MFYSFLMRITGRVGMFYVPYCGLEWTSDMLRGAFFNKIGKCISFKLVMGAGYFFISGYPAVYIGYLSGYPNIRLHFLRKLRLLKFFVQIWVFFWSKVAHFFISKHFKHYFNVRRPKIRRKKCKILDFLLFLKRFLDLSKKMQADISDILISKSSRIISGYPAPITT
jgi:hypothetical protein